jgi:hypothetical protein
MIVQLSNSKEQPHILQECKFVEGGSAPELASILLGALMIPIEEFKKKKKKKLLLEYSKMLRKIAELGEEAINEIK